jgi:polysaccharide biosynthesis/export protein
VTKFFALSMLFFLNAAWGQETSGSTPPPAYRLAAGDTIDIRFFFNPELNDVVQIRPDGRISLSLVGELTLAAKTITESVNEIEAAAAKELRTPRVTIQIRSYAGQKVFVTGEVIRPGTVNLPGEMTILEAIGEAGGMRPTANQHKTVLIRRGDAGVPVRMELILIKGSKPTAQAQFPLRPFDVILVPESAITHVDRWVDQYIRQMSPANLAVGFTYLWNKAATSPALSLPF